MRTYKYLNSEALVEVYKSLKQGIGPTEVGRKYGIYNTTVLGIETNIDKYLLSGKTPFRKNYIEAVKAIRATQENGVVTTKVVEADPYKILEDGVKAFIENSISPFVEALVAKKLKDRQNQIDKIEEENRQLKGLLENAKTQNWITNLKAKLG